MSGMRMAGAALGAGAVLGAGGLALTQHMIEQGTPTYAREMTQEDHARNNLAGMRERGVSVKDLAMYEGIRQGLMAGQISGEELYGLVEGGKVPAKVVSLLQDVIDLGAYMPSPVSGA